MVLRLIRRALPRAIVAMLCGWLLSVQAHAQSSLPGPSSTPGAINPAVTQANIGVTICVPGWTRTIRPPVAYTKALKRRQLQAERGKDGASLADFEEDHLIPIELGGAPADVRNLWPEPRHPRDGWTAERKDTLEDNLHRRVCSGRMALADAQRAFAENWTSAYRQFVRPRAAPPTAGPEIAAGAQPNTPGDGTEAGAYYRSVDGSMVHRPTLDGVSYGRVTAICADGSSSFSHHARGTCSHHGGVAEWR